MGGGGGGGEKKKNTFLPTHGKAELWSAANTCCSLGAHCRFTCGPSEQHAGFSLPSCSGQQSRQRQWDRHHTDKHTDRQTDRRLITTTLQTVDVESESDWTAANSFYACVLIMFD